MSSKSKRCSRSHNRDERSQQVDGSRWGFSRVNCFRGKPKKVNHSCDQSRWPMDPKSVMAPCRSPSLPSDALTKNTTSSLVSD